jgi:hypothetical protein
LHVAAKENEKLGATEGLLPFLLEDGISRTN